MTTSLRPCSAPRPDTSRTRARLGALLAPIVAALAVAAALAGPAAVPAAADEEHATPREKIEQAMEKAGEELQAKKYDEALATLAALLRDAEQAGLEPDEMQSVRQLVHYNGACALALKGEKEKALAEFEKALDAQFYDFGHIAKDPDLAAIRDMPKFKELIAKHEEKAEQAKAERVEKEKKALLGAIGKDALFPFDFDLKTVDGKQVKLADFKGKVLLVDVWGTWCGPCRAQLPHLVKLHEKLAAKGLAIVGLNVEDGPPEQAEKTIRDVIAKEKIPYPCALTPEGFTDKIPEFEGFPTVLLVDRAGKVRLKHAGYTEGVVLESVIEKLLAE